MKLLIYFNPIAETATSMKELVSEVAYECKRCDIPLFLEILTYSTSMEGEPLLGKRRTKTILRSLEELTKLGGDILKVEFPVDVGENRRIWEDACTSISQASSIPWVLLSAGVDSDLFLEQASIACAAGSSGILAGRAIWKEALSLEGENRDSFLSNTSKDRLHQLYEICTSSAKPWFEFYPPASVPNNWQDQYSGF